MQFSPHFPKERAVNFSNRETEVRLSDICFKDISALFQFGSDNEVGINNGVKKEIMYLRIKYSVKREPK